jgi:ribosome-associated toxin RatA of RatAB toxin-antitoxin module
MPTVDVERRVKASAERLWASLLDVERYPTSMSSVRTVRISRDSRSERHVAWSVLLKGAILEWEELELIDHDRLQVAFHQLAGDLAALEGSWRVRALGDGLATISLRMFFEIGIPLVADMLNPVAERAFYENCDEMLCGVALDAGPLRSVG